MPGQVKIGLIILVVLVAVIVVGELRDSRQPEQSSAPQPDRAPPTKAESTKAMPAASNPPAKKSEEDSKRRAIFFELVSCEDRVTADAAAKIPDDYSSAKAGVAAMERRAAYEKPRMEACRTKIMKEYDLDKAALNQISEEGIKNRWPPL